MKLLNRYQLNLQDNDWSADDAQLEAVQALDQLTGDLQKATSFWSRLIKNDKNSPRGLYLWGGVGRGKTYLMDLFYDELGSVPRKRQHFHRFMKDVHEQLKSLKNKQDPLRHVAQRINKQARVICFDEFFVSDIADAMILGRLFEKLFELGTVLVATSNVPPDELYKDGLQRSQFLPAIEAIKKYTRIMHVDGDTDYRLQVLTGVNMFHSPHDEHTGKKLEDYFSKIAPETGTRHSVMNLEGRVVETVRRADGVVWFTFDAICDGPRGPSDYIELARTFQTVIVSDVPQFDEALENQARRFITMVDEFYDRGVKLIISSATSLELLYQGKRLTFEFERTYSRLTEMQSPVYLARPHLP